jgi:hypothetical protein
MSQQEKKQPDEWTNPVAKLSMHLVGVRPVASHPIALGHVSELVSAEPPDAGRWLATVSYGPKATEQARFGNMWDAIKFVENAVAEKAE